MNEHALAGFTPANLSLPKKQGEQNLEETKTIEFQKQRQAETEQMEKVEKAKRTSIDSELNLKKEIEEEKTKQANIEGKLERLERLCAFCLVFHVFSLMNASTEC